MPASFNCIAPDLRGYGHSEDLIVDARLGARDWARDLDELLCALNIDHAHWLGWSAGAAAILQYALDHSEKVLSLTLMAPVSPYGFGGSRGEHGEPCFGDFAGSGGGIVSPEFIERIRQHDRSTKHAASPRNLLRNAFVKAPFRFSNENALLDGSLLQRVGEQRYPGDSVSSANWPFTAPGSWGPINAVSRRFLDLGGLSRMTTKPPILWIRGDSDAIVSDNSASDPASLGELGLIPGWPGAEIYPPQPMVAQTRSVLNAYRSDGGTYREMVLQDTGHSPFLEQPVLCRDALLDWIGTKGLS